MRFHAFLLLPCVLMAGCSLKPQMQNPPILESIEWSDIWIVGADKTDRPRVLLIGDSIVKGYGPRVEELLGEKAYCARYATSKFIDNPDFIAELDLILKRHHYDVIHINNGLHGWGYTDPQYARGVSFAITFLKKHVPQAKLIWAMTTPVRVPDHLERFQSLNDRVIVRNQAAAEIMTQQAIPINDLYDAAVDHPEYFSNDGVHYNRQGQTVQARQVVEAILEQLHLPNVTGQK